MITFSLKAELQRKRFADLYMQNIKLIKNEIVEWSGNVKYHKRSVSIQFFQIGRNKYIKISVKR